MTGAPFLELDDVAAETPPNPDAAVRSLSLSPPAASAPAPKDTAGDGPATTGDASPAVRTSPAPADATKRRPGQRGPDKRPRRSKGTKSAPRAPRPSELAARQARASTSATPQGTATGADFARQRAADAEREAAQLRAELEALRGARAAQEATAAEARARSVARLCAAIPNAVFSGLALFLGEHWNLNPEQSEGLASAVEEYARAHPEVFADIIRQAPGWALGLEVWRVLVEKVAEDRLWMRAAKGDRAAVRAGNVVTVDAPR